MVTANVRSASAAATMYCGTDETACDANNEEHPCQKDFGQCEVHLPPSCGKTSGSASGGRKIAYYASWNTRTRKCNRIKPSQIDTTGLTHLNFGYAGIDTKSFEVVPTDPGDVALYDEFCKLKSKSLQTWISIGGWNFSSDGSTHTTFSDMANSKDNRAAFIKSAISFMEMHGFQGIDLDWQYPGAPVRGGKSEDTENFVSLVKELREALGNHYGLSSGLPTTFPYLQFFDPKAMQEHIDWFNLQTYDLHGPWTTNPDDLKILPHTSNVEIKKGLVPLWWTLIDPKKINFGLAYYGRGYTIKDSSCATTDCPWKDASKPGQCTDTSGVMGLHEIQNLIKSKGLEPQLLQDAAVKAIQWDDQWMGYDDLETFSMKIDFANDLCFGGTVTWPIDMGSGAGSGDTPDTPDTGGG
ncbi:glycoside hydrolase superfamily, partial [Clohesyomyces aquaticus]